MNTEPALSPRPRSGLRILAHPALVVGLVSIALVGAFAITGRLALPETIVAMLGVGLASALASRIGLGEDRRPRDPGGEAGLEDTVARFADALTEPCLVINERAVLVFANSAARLQFPRARAGDPLAFTLRNPDLVEAVDKALASGQPQRTEVHISTPNEVWYRAAIMPYTPDPGRPQSLLVITLSDFTEQKRTDKMRGDFVANASHELRTPLTSLIGFIETLQGPAAKDEAARARFLGIMRGQAERMSGLIDDLLSLSRIELRQHVKPTGQVNLNLLVREVAESLEPRLTETGIVLNLDLPEQTITVTGDRQELFEVLENLADNAIKYGGDAGKVDIALTVGASRSGAYNAITVTDYGAGVAEEHVPRLTERFYRVDGEASRKKKGTGLGLAIVKHIVSRHQGEMSIRSRLGEGTRVEILLPR